MLVHCYCAKRTSKKSSEFIKKESNSNKQKCRPKKSSKYGPERKQKHKFTLLYRHLSCISHDHDRSDTDTPLSCDMSLTCPIRSHKARLRLYARHFPSKTVSDTAYYAIVHSTVYIIYRFLSVQNSSPTCPYPSLNLWAFSRPNTAYSNYRKLDSVA